MFAVAKRILLIARVSDFLINMSFLFASFTMETSGSLMNVVRWEIVEMVIAGVSPAQNDILGTIHATEARRETEGAVSLHRLHV